MRIRGLNRRQKMVPPGRETDIVGILSLHDVVSVIEQVYFIYIMPFHFSSYISAVRLSCLHLQAPPVLVCVGVGQG